MAFAGWHSTITDFHGNVVPKAQVTVRDEVTGALAILYTDREGMTGRGNPFLADDQGFAAFHVVGGAYWIIARSGAYEREWRYVGIGTAQETDIEEFGDFLQAEVVEFSTMAALLAFVPEEAPMSVVRSGLIRSDQVMVIISGRARHGALPAHKWMRILLIC